mmetsp:Transcript_6042/g.6907  ORF Transcript_6042/g.6907 Transcript_6042/m.6907 type:complete len:142 (+) Transcript_6042:110-535(+)
MNYHTNTILYQSLSLLLLLNALITVQVTTAVAENETTSRTLQKGGKYGGSSSSSSSSVADAIFEIDGLEVWGVGGTDMVQEGMQARGRSRDIRQANINKARKVDKAAFLDDLRSGVIENKAFAHRDQVQGRDGTCELLGGE